MERRLAAILAADMVGYSRLMGADEEGTITRQRDHREALIDPEIANHGGRIVKTMGDGLLVEFPSVVDALKCAVKLQAGMAEREADALEDRRIQYRIGINLGDIVIDGDDILGDGVNVAARLEGLAEPDGICISDVVHQSVETKLDLSFADMGAQQVKNIARPVRAFQVLLAGAAEGPDSEPPLPDKPSIAVLPFDNMSNDPEQEYFADGLAEDIITTLSKIPELLVIARNSTFTYKGQAVDIKQVGREQGVRYVLEGSVRKAGQRLRVTTQLIDAETGNHVWAERYDRALSDIFDLQDELTREVAIAMQVNLTKGEQAESWTRATESVAAWEQLMKGVELFLRHTKADNRQSLGHFEQAVKLDPDYVMAWVMLGWVHFNDARYSWGEAPQQSMALAWEYAEKAISLDDQNPDVLILLATLKLLANQHDEALELAERTVALNGNHSINIAIFGMILGYSERPQEAIETLQRAIRLSPIYPLWYHQNLARSYTQLGQYTDAIAQYKEAIKKSPEAPASYFNLAHVLFLSGKRDEARDAVAQGLRLNPRVTSANWRVTLPYLNPQRTEDELNSLRQSGLPEGDELEEQPPLPDKPSIAVLPFDNMSGDPEQGYFADGIAEDIITDLSKVSGLFVIARNSSFAYRGGSPDIRQVCGDLGVRYVLEGSVRKAGNRVRINAQLIEGETGGHMWAERYDRDLADIFAVQDEVTREIVDALQVALTAGEESSREGRRKVDPETYDLLVRGRELLFQLNASALAESRTLLESAINLDPDMAVAHAFLSLLHCIEHLNGWNDPAPDYLERAVEIAERARRIDPEEPQAYHALAVANLWLEQFEAAERAANRAVELNPNFAGGYSALGQVHDMMGLHESAVDCAETVLSLDPHYDIALQVLGRAQFALGRDDEAAANFERRLIKAPKSDTARVFLAAIHGHAGRREEAHQRWREIMEINPDFSVAHLRRVLAYKSPAVLDHLAAGLAKAGLPES